MQNVLIKEGKEDFLLDIKNVLTIECSRVFQVMEGGLVLKQGDMYEIHNRMEEVAELVVKKVTSEEHSVCTCPRCLLDMQALVLNTLSPDYVVLEKDRPAEGLIISLDSLERELFHHALAGAYQALDIVKSAPRHDDTEVLLHNYSEDIIASTLGEILQHRKTPCTCPSCMSKVMVHALNNLKPRYTTTSKGDVYARVDEVDTRHLATVYAAVYSALNKVEKEKRHTSEVGSEM